MKNILFISGSPRDGNTDYVLKRVFDATTESKEFVALRTLRIQECVACCYCKKDGICAIKDDMQALAKKLLTADTIVLGSPNYFANISGLMKTFIDRTFSLYHKSALKGKKIFLVVTGHSKDDTNKKYILQGTFGFVKYQSMKLINTYSFFTEDESAFRKDPKTQKKIEKIVNDINK